MWKRAVARRLSVTAGSAIAALVAFTAVACVAATGPAAADPGSDGATNATLQQQLDTAARAYNDAKGRLDASKARQADLQQRLTTAQQHLADLEATSGPIASAAYRGTRISMSALFFGQTNPEALLHDAATIRYLADHDNRDLHDTAVARKAYTSQKAALDGVVAGQEQQVVELAKRRDAVQKALGNPAPGTGVGGGGGKPTATPAPRNKDGSWPPESCSQKDPTTSSCLTPRTLHAYNEARAAGFTHYTACFRKEATGEHGKGRACDFSANATTFVNARATGADKAYGDKLAAWFIANADPLAVLYVIWYDEIWLPGIGWKKYTSGDGTPAGDHYNHVHLSVN